MSRVYERPRYVNQARNKLISLAEASHDVRITKRVCDVLKTDIKTSWAARADYESLAELALDGQDIDDAMPRLNTSLEEYLLDAEIGRMASKARLTAPGPAKKIVSDFLAVAAHHEPVDIYTDEQAVFWLVRAAYTDDRVYLEDESSRIARRRAVDLIHHQLASQKIAPGAFSEVFRDTPLTKSPPASYARAEAWATAAERLMTRSHPMWVKYGRLWAAPPRRVASRLQAMIDKVSAANPIERHRADTLGAVMPGSSCYNYAGIIVIFTGRTMLVMDPSCCAYFRTCMISWSNCIWAFSAHRVCGAETRTDYSVEFNRCIAWMARALESVPNARYLARHMHLTYTRWQNSVCEGDAPIDCGWLDRDKSLTEDILAMHPHTTSWWDLVRSFGIPERMQAEFLKLYHLLPPPDVDPLMLHEVLIERTANENALDVNELARFIKFCSAYDFCRFVSKRRKVPKHHSSVGMGFQESAWFKRCKQGHLTLPPEEEWGQVRISKEFPYDHTGDFHVLDAKDSTRVVADLGAYMDRARSRTLSKVDQNELLSAIFNGALLSNGETMEEWRSRVIAGGLTEADDIIAAEAGKAENTKPGTKVRETLSAADTVREYLTEVDHSIRPLAALTPGVSIRVDLVKHKKKFQAMAHAVSMTSHTHAFATSTDITGWSPQMPRAMFHAWQEYALGTTECENPRAQIELWDRLVLFCDRRGIKRADKTSGGNIQGWPATSDTTMHAHILIYWAHRLRSLGILSRKEAAHILCLIDDAATVVALEGTVDECTRKAERARTLLSDIYKSLGFIMDDVKSFFSSIKFVYLNELYIDGAQVMHGTKTIMRIDKDYTRRFASLTENIATAFGTAASAASQGADPFVAYFVAAMRSYMWSFRVVPELAEEPGYVLTALALAPVTLNGLGIRPITSVMATGAADPLTWFVEVVGTLCHIVNVPRLTKLFNHILDQEKTQRTAKSVFNHPSMVAAVTHRDATTAIRNAFRDAARDKGLAEPFASLDMIESDEALDIAIESILKEGTYEANVLEEIAASMPSALIDESMARVDRTELVSYLLGPTGIGSLRRRVNKCDAINLEVILDLSRGPYTAEKDYVELTATMGSFHVAKSIRDENLLKSGYHILNHTYPCPFAMWAYTGQVDMMSSRARKLTTVTFGHNRLRQVTGTSDLNMYDSVTSRPGYKGYRSLKSSVSNEIRAIIYNPVRKKVARGLAAIRWAQSNGTAIRALADLFLWSWAGEIDARLVALPGREVSGSVKRLSLRHSKTNHVIAPFQNCQSVVAINAMPVTQHHAMVHPSGSTMYDMMASITILRCAGLLEAALCVRRGIGAFEYGFAYKETPVPIVESAPEPHVMSHLEKVYACRAFVNTPGPLGAAAKKVCNYRVMSRTIDEYLDHGADAARRAFDAAVGDAGMDEEFAASDERGAVAVRVMTLAQRYDESAHIWEAHMRRQIPVAIGPAAPIDAPRAVTTSIATESPILDVRAACRRSAMVFRDSLALNLVEMDSRFAAELARSAVLDDPDWAASIESWDLKSPLLRIREREFLSLMRDIQKFNEVMAPQEIATMFFRFLGVIGFHYTSQADSLWQQAASFMGTALYTESAAKVVGLRLRDLKHSSAEEYASIRVGHGQRDVSAVTRVMRAQWRLAAERRAMRADRLATTGAGFQDTTALNYEAVFYRVAARTLRSTGRLSEAEWYSSVVNQVTESLANHIDAQSGRRGFTDRVAQADLDMPEGIDTFDNLVTRIGQIAHLAEQFSDSVSPRHIVAALTIVRGHVLQDITGAHLSTPYRPSRLSVTRVSAASTPRPSFGGSMGSFSMVEPPPLDINLDSLMNQGIVLGSAEDDDFFAVDPPDAVQWLLNQPGNLEELGITPEQIQDYYREITSTESGYRAWTHAIATRIDVTGYRLPEFSILGRPHWEGNPDGDEVAE